MMNDQSTSAVAFFYESAALNQEGYDQLAAAVGQSVDSISPAGRLAHLSGAMAGGGWRVIDVWESETAANAYYGSAEFAAVAATTPSATVTPWPLYRLEIDRTTAPASN
jgi:hypothetical protein